MSADSAHGQTRLPTYSIRKKPYELLASLISVCYDIQHSVRCMSVSWAAISYLLATFRYGNSMQ